MGMTGAELIWEVLAREGVEVVFGYPGGAILPAYDALHHSPIRHILVRHEQGAAHMADGYARASGKPGVALATSGPGATNLVTGIATTMMDSSPIVCITGQVPSGLIGRDAFQETDVTGITLPITKHNYLVTAPDEIGPVLKEAFHIARSGRPGPVLVDITKDAQQGRSEFDWEGFTVPQRPSDIPPRLAPSHQEIEKAARFIDQAERPLILAGQGVIQSGASRLLLEFAEKTGIPVSPTLLGLGGFPASHPLHLGMMGMHGEAWVNQAIQQADLLLAFGMRFDDRVTGDTASYAPKAIKIHVDIDRAEINKNIPVQVGMVADLSEALQALIGQVEARRRGEWLGWIEEQKGGTAVRDIQTMPGNGQLYAAHVIHDIWRLTSGQAIMVTDVGQHQMWEAQYYPHEYPRQLITSGGLGTMGFALPAAIGARFARPEAEIWVIAGDGGFQMTAAELSTCAQEKLKLNIAVINNHYLGMVRQWQEFFYQGRYEATPLHNPDFAKLAQAHGLLALRASTRDQAQRVIEQARQSAETVVVDFQVVQEDIVYPMVPAGSSLNEMIRRPEALVETASG
ncbi:MAG: biosynthetic-type acetolactate synthase large subunit [Acidobacteriota bacterium]